MSPVPRTRSESWKAFQKWLPSRKNEVLEAVKALQADGKPGATLHQIARSVGRQVHCVTSSVRGLVKSGKLEDSGYRQDNVDSGRPCIVWRTVK